MQLNLTSTLRFPTQVSIASDFLKSSCPFSASDTLDQVSDALDLIEVHERASARVVTLAGIGALVAFDAAAAVRHHLADGSRLDVVDAQQLAADGLSACGGILRAIVALGDREVASLARACAEDVAGALLGLREVPHAELS